MNRTRIKLVVCLLPLMLPLIASAQVSNIKEKAEKDTHKPKSEGYSSSKYSSSSSGTSHYQNDNNNSFFDSCTMIGYAVGGIAKGTMALQKNALDDIDTYPERTSLELSSLYAVDIKQGASNTSFKLKGSYGIFATAARYNLLKDATGKLNNFDWQVLMIRIPIKAVKLEYGIGFINLEDPHNSWFESSIGLDAGLFNNKGMLECSYRWTSKQELPDRFRQETNLSFGYELTKLGNLHFVPTLGVTRQNYYNNYYYNFLLASIKIRLY